jgi:hypothetical protein
MSVVISNTTSINYLVLIDHIAVLPHLYARVIIPPASYRMQAHLPRSESGWLRIQHGLKCTRLQSLSIPQGKANVMLMLSPDAGRQRSGPMRCRERLDGLLTYYYCHAA